MAPPADRSAPPMGKLEMVRGSEKSVGGDAGADGNGMTSDDGMGAGEGDIVPRKQVARKWFRKWVVQDTVLNSGKCFVLKWIREDMVAAQKPVAPPPMPAVQSPEHDQGVVYVCAFEGCGKVFTEAAALRKHAHVHGEKQYVCHYEGCGKRFVDSSKLKRHFLIHTGEKHFVCPFEGCGKAFSLDFNLRSHMRTHTGENYHPCPYADCGKRYAHEYKLRAHIKSHHEKESKHSHQSERALLAIAGSGGAGGLGGQIVATSGGNPPSAAGERPFGCPFEGCGKRYIHEYKLNLHLRKEHAQDVGDMMMDDSGGTRARGSNPDHPADANRGGMLEIGYDDNPNHHEGGYGGYSEAEDDDGSDLGEMQLRGDVNLGHNGGDDRPVHAHLGQKQPRDNIHHVDLNERQLITEYGYRLSDAEREDSEETEEEEREEFDGDHEMVEREYEDVVEEEDDEETEEEMD
ncbi:hypothetical protein CBR_g52462 [Chara braunii]|uniref:C2H2-type domain-containing protein n=1 Tax=Chara braunii TaxID=69332 RepID=A0A388MAC2_CHABU|nr:hypothetical protein CBR_g52462 [Chara braunii]|eukprot:GBG91506.1 hypothetical protein CBR_g52462 [Chara braunii]